jgi:hypothetical protein
LRPSAKTWTRSFARSRGFLPQIDGLPTGADLDALVRSHLFGVYVVAIHDPSLYDTDAAEWRRALVGRVGLALAFPEAAHRAHIIDIRDQS